MAGSKPRIFLWDNVKAILILLVVIGHFSAQFTPESNIMTSIYLIIHIFHMPLFVFVSGLFAKSSIKKGKLQIHKVISFLILFYALKLTIFLIGIPFGSGRKFYFFTEGGIPWYMFAMAAFLCLIYILRRVSPKILFPVSIGLSLLVGFFPQELDVLCLSRILVFFPYFLLGYYMNSEKLAEFTRSPKLRIISACILAGFIVLCFAARPFLYEFRPLIGAKSTYYSLPIWPLGPFYRLVQYAFASLLSLAFISILPNRKLFFSYLGAATLPIYFLHRPILYIFMDSGFGDWLSDSFGIVGLGIFLLIAVVLTFLLSIKPIRTPFNKLMQCRYGLGKKQT